MCSGQSDVFINEIAKYRVCDIPYAIVTFRNLGMPIAFPKLF
jgi:hypothetical protein